MTSTFGPRRLSPSWFHAGIDIENLGIFRAPFGCKIVDIGGTGDDKYIDIVPTDYRSDADYDVTHIRFRHISLYSDAAINKTYYRGDPIGTLLLGPNHLDMKTWYYSYVAGGGEGASNHPLKYFNYDLASEKRDTKISITNGLQVDSDGSHVKISITQPRNALSLNKIDFAFGEYLGSSTNTGDYMRVTNNQYTIWYEKRINVNPEKRVGSTFTPIIWNGIKIDPNSGVSPTKTVVFKIYCFKSPQVVEFVARDPKGNVVATKNDLQFSTCIGCSPPSQAPRPPTTLTATRVTNGIRLNWSLSPDQYGASTAYVIYRRSATSTDVLESSPIGIVKGDANQFTDYVYDERDQSPDINYKYSIAATNPHGEGCNGPLSNINCRPPAGKTCLEYCGSPLEKSALMPTGNSYLQQFNYNPNGSPGFPGHTLQSWGFSYSNSYFGVESHDDQGAPPNSSTYLIGISPGGGTSVAEAISPSFIANRNEAGLTFSWSMRFPSIPNYVKSTNLFATSLLNSSGQFLYTTTYTPTGLYDPWSGYDIELSKNNSTGAVTIGQALTSMDTPSWKWIRFRMTVDKTTAYGGDGTVRVFFDIGDGKGFKQYLSFKDEQHSQFSKFYIAYLTGTGSNNMRIFLDDFTVSKGIRYAQE